MSKHAERTSFVKTLSRGHVGRRSRRPWPQWVSLPLQALYLATSISTSTRYTFHHPNHHSPPLMVRLPSSASRRRAQDAPPT